MNVGVAKYESHGDSVLGAMSGELMLPGACPQCAGKHNAVRQRQSGGTFVVGHVAPVTLWIPLHLSVRFVAPSLEE